jgi:hypothetical protein
MFVENKLLQLMRYSNLNIIILPDYCIVVTNFLSDDFTNYAD